MRTPSSFALLLFALVACSRSTPPGAVDAGAPPKIVRPRITAAGEMPADLAHSQLRLSIIKDRDTKSPVTANVALRDGAVSLGPASGSARLSADLDSFDSQIPIRNERVRNIFFETSGQGWDSAELVVPAIPPAVIAALAKDRKAAGAKLDGTLSVHGRSAKITMTVDASYGEDGRLHVQTSVPAEVKISDYALTDNLHRLSAICMHDSIDDVVKVDATLEFSPAPSVAH